MKFSPLGKCVKQAAGTQSEGLVLVGFQGGANRIGLLMQEM